MVPPADNFAIPADIFCTPDGLPTSADLQVLPSTASGRDPDSSFVNRSCWFPLLTESRFIQTSLHPSRLYLQLLLFGSPNIFRNPFPMPCAVFYDLMLFLLSVQSFCSSSKFHPWSFWSAFLQIRPLTFALWLCSSCLHLPWPLLLYRAHPRGAYPFPHQCHSGSNRPHCCLPHRNHDLLHSLPQNGPEPLSHLFLLC